MIFDFQKKILKNKIPEKQIQILFIKSSNLKKYNSKTLKNYF